MVRTLDGSRLLRSLRGSTALVVSLAGLAAVSHPYVAQAALPVLPQGGTVVVGAASIASTSPGALNVTTATNHTAITWNSFSIGAGATVAINQPSASAVTLNEVTGANPSRIFGSLISNGQVVLANPNGIWFGPGSHVDVASLVASTATASQAALEAFAKGGALMLDQAGNPSASIVNDGSISIGAEGLAGLVAPGVANNGVIAAKLGHVVLASGTVATLDFYGDGLISFAVGGSVTAQPKDQAGKALAAAVTNSGSITAPGGTVLLTAAAAKTVVDNTINMSGVVVASAIAQNGGEIDLEGGSGTTTVSGTLQASSKTGAGGTIDVTGKRVQLAATASLTASGTSGGTIAVGGGVHGGGSLAHAEDVSVAQGATLTADGTTGTGGTISVWSDGATQVAASLTAIGAVPGGLVETSGETLDFGGISVKASNWLLDPVSLELTDTDQANINSALATSNVTLITSASGAPTGGYGTTDNNDAAGDIIVDAAGGAAPNGISWSTNASLTLNAHGAIIISSGAKIENSGGASISLYSGNGVSVLSSAVVSTTSGGLFTTGGGAGSEYAGTLSAYAAALSDSVSLSLSGSLTAVDAATIQAPQVTISGTLASGYGVSLLASTGLTVGTGASIVATNGTISDYGLAPTIAIDGSLTGNYITLTSTYLSLATTASLHAAYNTSLLASSAFSLPSGSTQLVSSPSLTLSYGGGPIQLGGAAVNGDLNLTTAALTQLGAASATSLFAIYDIASSGGSITTSGSLSFPGALSLVQGSGATLDLGGSISLAGSGGFGSSTGSVEITGSISGGGSYYDPIAINAGSSIDVASTASLSNGSGTISLHDNDGSSNPGTSIEGIISAASITLLDNYNMTLASTAKLTGTSAVSLSAGSSLALPTTVSNGSSRLIAAPTLNLSYGGGPIELGTNATAGLALTPTILAELGVASGGGTSSFSVYDTDTTSASGSITTDGTLVFPAGVTLVAGTGATLTLGGTISVDGYSSFSAPSGAVAIPGTISSGAAYQNLSIYATTGVDLAATGSLFVSYGSITLTDNDATGSPGISIAGSISGGGVTLTDNYGMTLASTAQIAGTSYVSLSAGTALTLPTSLANGATRLITTPSLNIAYGGGPIEIGSNTTSGLALTPTILAELGAVSGGGTTYFDVDDTAALGGSITTDGTLTFPGSLSLTAGAGATLTLAGLINFDGSATFANTAVYFGEEYDGSIDITGTLNNSAPSNADTTIRIYAGDALLLASGASINDANGSVSLSNTPYSVTSGVGTTIDGTISGTTVSIYDSYSLTLTPVSIAATAAADINAAQTLVLPTGSSAVVTSPSLTIVYSGGPVEIGGTVTGDLNFTAGVLTALGYGSATGLSQLFEVDTANNTSSGMIATSGSLNSPGSVSLVAGNSLTIGGPLSLDGTGYFSSGYPSAAALMIDGSISDRGTGGISIFGYNTVSLSQGVSVSAGSTSTIELSVYSEYSTATASIAGSLTAQTIEVFGQDVNFASTALLNASAISLSAATAYSFPNATETLFENATSLTIAFEGGPIQIGSATIVSGDLNLTPTVLGDIGAFSATGGFTLIDNATGGSITTSGTLPFTGALSLQTGYSALLTLGGNISFDGAGNFDAYDYYYSTGSISVTGKLIDAAPSGSTSYGVSLSAGGVLTIAAGATISDQYGSITLDNSPSATSGNGTTIDGTITGAGVTIYDSYSLTLNPVLISATSAYFSAAASLALPSGSTPVVEAASLTIVYGGGAIGLGTAALGSGGTPLDITTGASSNLIALGLGSGGGSGTGVFSLEDTSSANSSIVTASGLTFYGGLSLSIYSGYSGSALIDLGGNLTVAGALTIDSDDYEGSSVTDIGGTITAGSFSLYNYYGEGTVLTANTVINTSADNGMIYLGSVDGAYNLTLNAGSGTLILGTVGATTHLGSLTITAGSVTLPAITVTGNLTVNTADQTYVDGLITVIGGGSTVFNSDTSGTDDYESLYFYSYSGISLNTSGPVTASYHPYYYTPAYASQSYFSAFTSQPVAITLLVDTANDLSSLSYDGNLGAHYALNNNISMSSVFSSLIGTSASPFTGIFDGRGYTITNLSIAQSSGTDVGLFGMIGAGALVENFGLVNAVVTGHSVTGALAGLNLGTISGVYSTGVISGSTIAGGLVGENQGTIANSYSTAKVIIGGGSIAGGLVGQNDSAGSIETSFAAGEVSYTSAAASYGGLVGINNGVLVDSYWDTDTTGISTPETGANGETTFELTSGPLPSGFSSDEWSAASGGLPYLSYQGGAVATPLAANTDLVSGSVLTGYDGSTVSGVLVDIVVDGAAVGGSSTNSDGVYSVSFATSLISGTAATHLVTAYLDPSDDVVGSTSHDDVTFSSAETGFDIYEGVAAIVANSATSLSTIATEIAAQNIASSSLLLNITTGNSASLATTGNHGLLIKTKGTSFTINEPVTVAGTFVINASSTTSSFSATSVVSAGTLKLNGTETAYLFTNSANAISAVTVGDYTTSIGSLDLVDSIPLTIGATTATSSYENIGLLYSAPSISITGAIDAPGFVEFLTQSLTLGDVSSPVVTANEIELGVASSGGTIAIGSGLGTPSGTTLQLSSGLLDDLLAGTTSLYIGNSGATIDIGSISLSSATLLDFVGTTISISGAFAANSASVGFTGTNGGTITVTSSGTVTAGTITAGYGSSGSEIIAIDGDLTATTGDIDFTAGSGGSVSIASGISLTAADGIYLSGTTLGVSGNLAAGGNGTADFYIQNGGSFTESAGVTISGYDVDIQTSSASSGVIATIDGTLTAGYYMYIETGTGGTLTLGTGAVLNAGSGYLTIDSDTQNIPSPSGVLISAAYVSLDQGYPSNSSVISVGTETISGALNLTAADLSLFASASSVTIGNTSNTELTEQGILLGSNYVLNSAVDIVSGYAYNGVGGSALSGVSIDLIIDGITSPFGTATTNGYGYYSFSFHPQSVGLSGSTHEVAAYVATAGDYGESFYDGATLSLYDLNIYAHTVFIQTAATSLSAALTTLATEIADVPSAEQLLTVSAGTLNTTNAALDVLDTSTGSVTIDETVNAGTGAVLITGYGSLTTADAVAAGSVTLDADGATVIDGSVTTTGTQSYTGTLLSFASGVSLTSSAGTIAFQTNSLGLPAAISAADGVSVDTYTTGGTIGLGDAAETFDLTQSELTVLGANGLTIGDTAATVVIGSTSASTLTLPSSLTIKGADVSVYGTVTLDGSSAVFDVSETQSNSQFILQSGGDITAATITIDPEDITIEGLLSSSSAINLTSIAGGNVTLASGSTVTGPSVTLDSGEGGTVALMSGSTVSTSGALTIDTDNLSIPSSGAAPSISAGSVTLAAGSPDEPIAIGTSGSSGLSISLAALELFGSIPLTVGGSGSVITVSPSILAEFPNLTIGGTIATTSLSGDVYVSYGSTTGQDGGSIELVIDGSDYTATLNSSGFFTVQINSPGSSTYDIAIVVTSGGTGTALYDVTAQGLPATLTAYDGSVLLWTNGTSLATALGNLSNQFSSLSNDAQSLDSLLAINSGGLTVTNGIGLIINAAGSALALDAPISSSDNTLSSLTFAGAGSITEGTAPIYASTLTIGGSGTYTLGATGNQIDTVSGTATFSSLTLDDEASLTLGSMTATGAINLYSDDLSAQNGATIQAGGGITVDTLASGATIGLGSATGGAGGTSPALVLSADLLAVLGANSTLTIGDGANAISEADAVSVAQSVILDGSSFDIGGSITLTGVNAAFSTQGNGTGTFTLESGGAITASDITINASSISVDGALTGVSEVDLAAGASGIVDVSGTVNVTGSTSLFTTSGSDGTSAFTLASGGAISAATITIDPQVINISGTLTAGASGIDLTTGVGGSVNIDSGAVITSTGTLSIDTDNFSIATTGTLPVIDVAAIDINTAPSSSAQIGIDDTTTGALNITGTELTALGIGSTLVTVGTTSSIVNVTNATLAAYPNLNVPSLGSTIVSGDAYNGSNLIQSGSVDIVFNGSDRVATINDGRFEAVVYGSSSQYDIVIVLTSGGTGSAFYDMKTDSFTGLNVYAGSVLLSTDDPMASQAIQRLGTQVGYLTTGSSLKEVTLGTDSIIVANGFGLIIQATGATLDIDGSISTQSNPLPSLTLEGSGTITEGTAPIYASTLTIAGSGAYDLDNTGNQITGVAGTTTFSSLTLDDSSAVTLGGMTATGDITINDNAIAVAAGQTIQAGAVIVDTLNTGGTISLGDDSSGTLVLSTALLSALGASADLVIGDGSNTIDVAGTVGVAQGITFGGAVVLTGATTINGGSGTIEFERTVNAQFTADGSAVVSQNDGLTLDTTGDIFFDEAVGTVTTDSSDPLYLPYLTIINAYNVTVSQTQYTNGAGTLVYPGIYVHGFSDENIAGTLNTGNHSLESDGDVSIIATTVEGRIVAGNDASISANTITGATVQAGNNIQVVATNSITDSSFTATRSANISAQDSISNTVITAGTVAQINAPTLSGDTVTAPNISATSSNFSGDKFNSPNPVQFNGGDPSQGGNTVNGQPVTTALVQLATLTVPTNATDPKVSTDTGGDVSAGGDDGSGSGPNEKKKKGEKGGKNGAESAAERHKSQSAKTYDAANQFLNKLLSAKKPAAPPI